MFKIKLKLNKKILKRAVFGVIIIGLLSVYCIYIYSRPDKLEVIFLDVGQGDAILVKTPYGQTILIDGGPDNRVLRRLGQRLPYYQRQIDFVVISHYHDDHTVGLVELAKRFRIGQLIYASDLQSSPAIQELSKYIGRQRSGTGQPSYISIESQAKLPLGPDCTLDLLSPTGLEVKADGNNSLVAKLDCLGRRFLFTGDSGAAVEKVLLKSGWELKASVLKASHHGSNSANSEGFLRAVSPGLLAISVGSDNKFGHPHPKVLDRAESLGISVRRTDQEGDLLISIPAKIAN